MIKEVINYFKIIQFDSGLVMAIIAINMTVIGLTSLADKKTVIGVDYGEFLIKKFKLLKIRMYYWLILFALINVISLFIMFIDIPQIQIINSFILIFSLIFAILYFFGFILVENKWVIKQIYIEELLGLYCHSKDKDHFNIDLMVNMNSGTRTSKKLSTNVTNYFNNYNADTEKAFKEIFGPDSVIYSEQKSIIRARKKNFDIKPYRYRTSDINKNIKDISFEFFQLFRFVEHQSRWALDILLVLNGDYEKYNEYDIHRLYNFARLTAHIKTFGISEDLFKYKFLYHYRNYWYSTVNKEKKLNQEELNKIENIKDIEKEIIKSLFSYISRAIKQYRSEDFTEIVEKILEEILIDKKYKGFLSNHEVLNAICKASIKNNCKELQEIIEKIISKYKIENTSKKNIINIDKLRREVNNMYKENEIENTERVNIFNSRELEISSVL